MFEVLTFGATKSRSSFSCGTASLALPPLEILDDTEHRWDLSPSESSDQVVNRIDSLACGLPEFVAEHAFAIPDVVAVAFQWGGDTLHVWTFLSAWTEEQANRVYDVELALMQEFPEVPFDFYVLSRADRPIETLLRSTAAYIVTRGDADNG